MCRLIRQILPSSRRSNLCPGMNSYTRYVNIYSYLWCIDEKGLFMSIGEDRKDLRSRRCGRRDGNSANEEMSPAPEARKLGGIFKPPNTAGAKTLRVISPPEAHACDTGVIVSTRPPAAFHRLRPLPGVLPVDRRRGERSPGYSLTGEHVGSLLSQDIKHIGYGPE